MDKNTNTNTNNAPPAPAPAPAARTLSLARRIDAARTAEGRIKATTASDEAADKVRPFTNGTAARDGARHYQGKALSAIERALDAIAYAVAVYDADSAQAATLSTALEKAHSTLSGATLSDAFGVATMREGARVRIAPSAAVRQYIARADGMRTVEKIVNGMATLSGGVIVPVSDLIAVK